MDSSTQGLLTKKIRFVNQGSSTKNAAFINQAFSTKKIENFMVGFGNCIAEIGGFLNYNSETIFIRILWNWWHCCCCFCCCYFLGSCSYYSPALPFSAVARSETPAGGTAYGEIFIFYFVIVVVTAIILLPISIMYMHVIPPSPSPFFQDLLGGSSQLVSG